MRCPISMIIAVQNNEESLIKSIESIESQSFKDYELILINNGSTDNSAALCEDLRGKDQRIKVIHMEQGETALAYNKAIELATGRYLHFIKAGDTLEEGVLETISDLLWKSIDVIFLKTSVSRPVSYWDISHNNILRRLGASLPEHLWDKLIRRELLSAGDIRFSEGNIWESVDFCMSLYIQAQTYGAIEFDYYRHTLDTSEANTELEFNKILLTLSKWTGPADSTLEEYSQFIHRLMAAMYCDRLIPMYRQLPAGLRGQYKTRMNDFFWLFYVRKSRRDQILKVLYAALGLGAASGVIKLYDRYLSKI